jgi:hypothetical protein
MTEQTSSAMEMPPPAMPRAKRAPILPRRRFFSDMPDRGLFCVVAAVGFAGICWLKLSGFQPEYVAGSAVALMIAYGFAAFNIPLVQMRPDRLGDNFYYLGFILTLASLTAALFQLRRGMRIDEELLGSFGIALVTTIVGIAGRVAFVQLRGEIDEVEEQTRRDLATASAELKSQFIASISEFEVLRAALLQTFSETSDAMSKARQEQEHRFSEASGEFNTELRAVLKEFEAFRTKFAKASMKHLEQIDELAGSSADRVRATFDARLGHADQTVQALQSMSKVVEDAVNRVLSAELPSDRLNAEISEFGIRLNQLADRLSAKVQVKPRRFFTFSWWWR